MKVAGENADMMSEINVTPLVDVMLVLLVIFIITAPLLVPRAMGIRLPQTVPVTSQAVKEQARLVVYADGSLELDRRQVSVQQLRELLGLRGSDPKFQLQIEADDAVRYGRIAEIMATAQSAGISRLTFLTVSARERIE